MREMHTDTHSVHRYAEHGTRTPLVLPSTIVPRKQHNHPCILDVRTFRFTVCVSEHRYTVCVRIYSITKSTVSAYGCAVCTPRRRALSLSLRKDSVYVCLRAYVFYDKEHRLCVRMYVCLRVYLLRNNEHRLRVKMYSVHVDTVETDTPVTSLPN
jgi:hypothetical protein